MKYIYTKFNLLLTLALLAVFILKTPAAVANEGENMILIMGQVKTATYGYPVIGHTVYITNDSLGINNFNYYKELITNQDGYYYDTITTEFNSGSFMIYTFDPNNNRLDTSVFFRFSEHHNDNIFVVNFSLLKDATDNSLQASFEYENIEDEGKFRYAFFDRTKCDDIIKWVWTFGDGSISNEQNPKHTFSHPGLYTVSLTVTGYVENELEINTTYQYLFIPEFSYYHMGGHCFAKLFPIDKGLAYLYRIEGESVYRYDTTWIDTLGYYYFYQVAEGDYYVKLQPSVESVYYGELIPTYFGDNRFWEEAQIIHHNGNNFEYDVDLIEGTGLPAGEGLISGVVTDETGGKFRNGEDTRGVDIYLLSENEEILTCRYTDHNSCFEFEDIPLDTYYLIPEITGVPQTRTRITLNADIPERDEISINVETGEVVLAVGDENFNEGMVSAPFPNPAAARVNLQVNLPAATDLTIKVYDLSGRMLGLQEEALPAGQHRVSLGTESLKNGIYIIRLESDKGTFDQKFLVSR